MLITIKEWTTLFISAYHGNITLGNMFYWSYPIIVSLVGVIWYPYVSYKTNCWKDYHSSQDEDIRASMIVCCLLSPIVLWCFIFVIPITILVLLISYLTRIYTTKIDNTIDHIISNSPDNSNKCNDRSLSLNKKG